ncbi:unnamed protein product [Absidia cylindrospora]
MSKSTTYWYSTNGMDRKRLADRHVTALDEAFDRQARVQIFDDEAFGNRPAFASPHLGTMTSGDIHYGLYRQPSLWEDSMPSLDSMKLVLGSIGNGNNSNNTADIHELATSTSFSGSLYDPKIRSNSRNSSTTTTTTTMRRRQQLHGSLDEFCCVIT